MTVSHRYQKLAAGESRGWLRQLPWLLRRSPPLQLLGGLFLGVALSALLHFESSIVAEDKVVAVLKAHDDSSPLPSLFLRCVVTIERNTPKPASFASAIAEGYAKRCNQTIFYTNSKNVQKQIKDQHVVLVDSVLGPAHWPFYRSVLEHSSRTPVSWTLIGDEQLFAVVENLRKSLASLDQSKGIIVGRVKEESSLLSWLFPLIGWRSIAIEAGVVVSSKAMPLLLQHCSSFWDPRSSSRALFYCASDLGIQIVDPVDEDQLHLFHEKNMKTLIGTAGAPEKHSHAGHSSPSSSSPCCSEHAATFGGMSYKDHRVAEYASYHLRVFGKDGVDMYNHTTTAAPTTTTKKADAKEQKKKEEEAKKKKEEEEKKKKEEAEKKKKREAVQKKNEKVKT